MVSLGMGTTYHKLLELPHAYCYTELICRVIHTCGVVKQQHFLWKVVKCYGPVMYLWKDFI